MAQITRSKSFNLNEIADQTEAYRDFVRHARMVGMTYESMNAHVFMVLEIMKVRSAGRDEPFFVVILMHPDEEKHDSIEMDADEQILLVALYLSADLIAAGISPDEFEP